MVSQDKSIDVKLYNPLPDLLNIEPERSECAIAR